MFIRVGSWVFYLLFLSVFTFSSCSQDNENSKKNTLDKGKKESVIQYGGVYKLPLDINPTTLDPAYIEDDFGVSVAYQLFDGLVQYGPYLTVQPALAKDWKIEEQGKIVRFFLRHDAYFHNGKPVTAKDVVFSLKRLFKIEPAPSILPHLLNVKGAQAYRNNTESDVSGLVAIGDYQLEIRLQEPYAPLLGALAMYQASIVPEEVVMHAGPAFGKAPVGSGPFKFVDWQSDQMIRLERYPGYYSGASYLEAIEYRIYPGAQRDRVLSDFKKGLLEEMPVYGTVRQELAEAEDLTWVHRPSLSLLFYGINISHPLLGDQRLRKALALVINREELVEKVYNSQFEPARSILPPGMVAHNRQTSITAPNIAEAERLITEVLSSQAEKELTVELVSASKSAFARAEFDFIAKSWAQIGVVTTIRYITDWSEFEDYLNSDAMQIFRYSWTADMPDPDNFLGPLFGSDSPVNYTGFRRQEIDNLLKQASGMIDDVKRAQLYQEIEKQIMQTQPVIPLFYLSIDRVYQPEVQGIHSSPLGWQAVRLHRTWLKSTAP